VRGFTQIRAPCDKVAHGSHFIKHVVHRGKGNYIFVKSIGFLCQVSKALSIGTLKKPTWVFTMDKKPQMRDIHKI
jgi:hypothetical protein